jgi:hypothetical protein
VGIAAQTQARSEGEASAVAYVSREGGLGAMPRLAMLSRFQDWDGTAAGLHGGAALPATQRVFASVTLDVRLLDGATSGDRLRLPRRFVQPDGAGTGTPNDQDFVLRRRFSVALTAACVADVSEVLRHVEVVAEASAGASRSGVMIGAAITGALQLGAKVVPLAPAAVRLQSFVAAPPRLVHLDAPIAVLGQTPAGCSLGDSMGTGHAVADELAWDSDLSITQLTTALRVAALPGVLWQDAGFIKAAVQADSYPCDSWYLAPTQELAELGLRIHAVRRFTASMQSLKTLIHEATGGGDAGSRGRLSWFISGPNLVGTVLEDIDEPPHPPPPDTAAAPGESRALQFRMSVSVTDT